ncbi:hypothetical protein Misp03_42960 [Microbispora sp. NBRC 16548]|nr:hypothetical protein Misp03_42960 [Microbispora sp. NBRC 16548]
MTSHKHPRSGQRAFLRRILDEGAESLGVAVFGRFDRTVGSAAPAGGGRFRLRATAEHHWAHGEAWTGNPDAAAILERLFGRALDLPAQRTRVRASRSRSC